MRLSISLPGDGQTHEYCVVCQAETVSRKYRGEQVVFECSTCGRVSQRSLYFDGRKAWLQDGRELWHATVGVLVRGESGRFLFFQRTRYAPLGLTIPAGHVDGGETADEAAYRELMEETGIIAKELRHLADVDIHGDSCSSGADVHRWHLYMVTDCPESRVAIQAEEGAHPVWLSLAEARTKDLVFGTQHIIDHLDDRIVGS